MKHLILFEVSIINLIEPVSYGGAKGIYKRQGLTLYTLKELTTLW